MGGSSPLTQRSANSTASAGQWKDHLLTADLFAAPAKLLMLEDGDLVAQLLDTGLPITQFACVRVGPTRLLLNLPVPLLYLDNQLRCEDAQMFRAEGVKVGRQVHATSLPEPQTPWKRNCLLPSWPHTTRITPFGPMRCHGKPST